MSKRISLARRSLNALSHEDDDELTEEQLRHRELKTKIINYIKIGVFLLVWLYFTIFILITPPHEHHEIVVPVAPRVPEVLTTKDKPNGHAISIWIQGHIDELSTNNALHGKQKETPRVIVSIQFVNIDTNSTVWKAKDWIIYLAVKDKNKLALVKNFIYIDDKDGRQKSALREIQSKDASNIELHVTFLNLDTEATAFEVEINANPLDPETGIIYGFALLIFLYVLIITEITDRTFAALLTSTAAIGVLCMLNARPSLEKIITWIDMQTVMLLFGMMIMVSILTDTGIFDYLSIFAYQLSKGNIWLLVFYLSMFTGFVSAFLDNVTMVLLMAPVTIRLCELLGLRTTVVLIIIVVFSNIGGTLTPVGDPPNVIIATDRYVVDSGIKFGNFTLHMFPGVFLSMMLAFLVIYLMLRKKLVAEKEDQLNKSIAVLKKQLRNSKKDPDLARGLQKNLDEMVELLNAEATSNMDKDAAFTKTLKDMKEKYKIKNKLLLIKCAIAFIFAIGLFFLHSLPFMAGVTLSWAAILAALLLLILANKPDIDSAIERVEWSTLIFFAALFVLMEALVEMGLIDWVGEKTINMILSVHKDNQLAVAILLLVWISAITSAFVDNIPITTMMLKLTIKLASNETLDLPISPLIWALSYGACFGGNGTLIGASANVVTAGIASQYGHNITFKTFFIIGFPIMIITVVICTIYLLIAHCLFTWH